MLETYENLYTLVVTVFGLFICLTGFVRYPRRGWVYISFFFLGRVLSEYHWTVYTFIIGDNPEISAVLAYFGWNVAYLMLFMFIRSIQSTEERRYFNLLMLLPIPVNIAQLCLYLTFGGIFNNVWQVTLTTLVAMCCIQSILYYLKHKNEGVKKPAVHIVGLIFIANEYCMWTASCYFWEDNLYNPYYWFAIIEGLLLLLFACVIYRTRDERDKEEDHESVIGIGYSHTMRALFLLIIVGCCFGGYMLAQMIHMRVDAVGADGVFSYASISALLFYASVAMVALTISLMYAVHSYYRNKSVGDDKKRELRGKFNFAITLVATFLLMGFAVIYMMRLLYKVSVLNLYANCDDKIVRITDNLEDYFTTAGSVLWVTADTVDHMTMHQDSDETIRAYLRVETKNQAIHFDENFIGLYGYIQGKYMDGLDWVPPAGYVPSERDWYIKALEANGDIVMISPYVDAYTGDVIISVSKMLTDGKSVISMDVAMNRIQDMIEEIDIAGGGYGMILTDDGLIVAHSEDDLKGRECSELYGDDFMNRVIETGTGRTSMDIDGENHIVFVSRVMDKWYSVILISSDELFRDVHTQIIINGVLFLIVFMLIIFFYAIGYFNTRNANRMMEALSEEKRKQEYEATVLRLEKSVADQANQAKSRFLADMSHEIRTPINAVLGMNEMILRESDSDDIKEYARNIQSSGKALLSLINSILDFSKIEDGKMELEPTNYKTVDLIRYLIKSVEERAADKGLRFIADVDPTIPSILHGDDIRLEQVIVNLLTNAVKYTESGSIRLTLRNGGIKDGTLSLFAEVKDTGIGIKEEDRDKLFESFERLEMERNRTIEGTGLGMSIVTKLLDMMGSKLSLESEYGKGSTFSFTVSQEVVNDEPVGDAWKSATVAEDASVVTDNKSAFTAPSAKALIVDDTRMNLLVVKNLLKHTLMQVDTASSGEEALNKTLTDAYDIIFMDQRMPGMDGVEAFHRVKEQTDGKNTDTPVICLTADAISGARDRYLAEGFADYLTKPIDPIDMEKVLQLYLPSDKIEHK